MNMNTTCRNWLAIAFLGCWKFAVCVSADAPPPEAAKLIEDTKRRVDQFMQQGGNKIAPVPLTAYLNLLSTNWSQTIKKDPGEVADAVRASHEVMQFYFAGRSEYSIRTLDTLLHPRIPGVLRDAWPSFSGHTSHSRLHVVQVWQYQP